MITYGTSSPAERLSTHMATVGAIIITSKKEKSEEAVLLILFTDSTWGNLMENPPPSAVVLVLGLSVGYFVIASCTGTTCCDFLFPFSFATPWCYYSCVIHTVSTSVYDDKGRGV